MNLDNSTCCVSRIRLAGVHPFLEVNSKSLVTVSQCIFGVSDEDKSPIVSSGQVVMNEIMSINCPYTNSLVRSSSSESLTIHSCLFRDTVLTSRLSCLGDIDSCDVSSCSFINISCNERNRAYGRCFSSVLKDCLSSDGVMGIYGEIVSGIAQENNGIGYSFTSSNNTFIECYRNRLYHDMDKNTDYNNQEYTTQLNLSTSASHSFNHCTFTDCTPSVYGGGAICFNPSTPTTTTSTITISSCTFTGCTAGNGGAVCCGYTSSCVVSGCSFVNCNATSYQGGSINLDHISTCAAVKDSNISSCKASYGGGMFFTSCNVTGKDCEGGVEYGIVSGCHISGCNASSTGGGIYIQGVSITTIRSSYFYSCYSYNYGGGIYWPNPNTEQVSLSEWILDCVFELNTANSHGHDVYIQSSASRSTSIFDDLSYTRSNRQSFLV